MYECIREHRVHRLVIEDERDAFARIATGTADDTQMVCEIVLHCAPWSEMKTSVVARCPNLS